MARRVIVAGTAVVVVVVNGLNFMSIFISRQRRRLGSELVRSRVECSQLGS